MRQLISWLLPLILLAGCVKPGPDGPSTTAPATPDNLVVKAVTDNSATFQWDPVEGASFGWKIMKGSETVKNGVASGRNVTVDGLSAGTAYVFNVWSIIGSVSSGIASVELTTTGTAGGSENADAICADAPLVLKLDGTPVLGSSGCIKVFNSSDAEVDRIDLADLATVNVRSDGTFIPREQIGAASVRNTFMDVLHSAKRWRTVHYTPLRIKGNSLEIKLHNDVLEFGKSYYVTVDESVAGKAVAKGEWAFSVKAKPSGNILSVRQDGSGDFCTVQGALSYASTLPKADEVTIEIGSGSYNEMLFLRDKDNVTLKGASRNKTIISYPNNESYCGGSGSSSSSKPEPGQKTGTSGGRGLWLVENCNNLVVQDLTIENSFGEQKGQAEAIYFNSSSNSHRLTIESCNLLSYQDTFLCKGEVWVHNSLIAGHCDFIWGYPKACLFENCEIRARAAGYIVQARVPSAAYKGFVFLNCKLSGEDGGKDGSMYLARSAGQSDCYDNVVFIGCSMASVIAPVGWYTSPPPNPAKPDASAGWREYGSTDASGKPLSGHNSLGIVLSESQAAAYSSKEAVLGW